MGAMSAPSYAQGYGGYNYPPPPQNPYATPWVGTNTPWTFYQGDWFLNGYCIFFGNQYGWAAVLRLSAHLYCQTQSGMRRSGMRGINAIRITGGLLNKSIPIGADIVLVSVMTRIFIISTIAARGKVGIKDSMASVLLKAYLGPSSIRGPGVQAPGAPVRARVRPRRHRLPAVASRWLDARRRSAWTSRSSSPRGRRVVLVLAFMPLEHSSWRSVPLAHHWPGVRPQGTRSRRQTWRHWSGHPEKAAPGVRNRSIRSRSVVPDRSTRASATPVPKSSCRVQPSRASWDRPPRQPKARDEIEAVTETSGRVKHPSGSKSFAGV